MKKHAGKLEYEWGWLIWLIVGILIVTVMLAGIVACILYFIMGWRWYIPS